MKKHCVILLLLLSCGLPSLAYEGESVLSAMKRATKYMMEVASYEGGFVWSYLPDYSRQWGELEARRTMVWLQPPGTPAVGHLMLDAYHATTDEYYYQCAKKIADVLMKGQLPCGGWNYVFDLEGEEALKQWYATIGKQAWRLEEFQHYYGNATFDDGGTMQAAEFFLRMYLEEKTKTKDGNNRYEEPLNKAIRFVLDSQYDNGGWPQRYPLMYDHPFRDMADYTSFITLNDDVIIDAIEFLQHCSDALHRPELKAAAERAMLLVARLQSSKVNNQKSTVEGRFSGWADQYTVNDLQPAHARSYEPRSINTGTTAKVVRLMLSYYRQTGNKVFLQGVPDAINWLRSQKLSAADSVKWGRKPRRAGDILVPRFIHPETGKPMYVHRVGSNVKNGHYYTDGDISGTIDHYSSATYVNPDTLWAEYQRTIAANNTQQSIVNSQRSIVNSQQSTVETAAIISSLTPEGYWLTPLRQISNPYKPLPKKMKQSKDKQYQSTMVGEEYDTSPYTPDTPVMGISTQTFLINMTLLIRSLK